MSRKTILTVLSLAGVFIIGLIIYPWSGGHENLPATASAPAPTAESGSYGRSKPQQSPAPKTVKTAETNEKPAHKTGAVKPMGPPPAHLEFIGTVKKEAENPCAVIRNKAEEIEDIYCIEDTIDNGRIIRIERNGVLVEKEKEKYVLPRAGFNSKTPEDTLPPGHDLPPTDFSRPNIDQIEKGWEAVQTLMRQIELNEHTSDGEAGGVVVRAVKSGSVFDKAGLKQGDIIHSINDKKITIVDDAMEIYETFRTASSVHIKVTRNGAPVDLSFQP
ncbi:MAG: PDZ domain-containing protein [Desulfobacterales bacterium]|nr:PDZ domain-containing protein [Desulfobacterales bacterium]